MATCRRRRARCARVGARETRCPRTPRRGCWSTCMLRRLPPPPSLPCARVADARPREAPPLRAVHGAVRGAGTHAARDRRAGRQQPADGRHSHAPHVRAGLRQRGQPVPNRPVSGSGAPDCTALTARSAVQCSPPLSRKQSHVPILSTTTASSPPAAALQHHGVPSRAPGGPAHRVQPGSRERHPAH